MSMKMASNFTAKEFGRRFRKALSVPFIFDQACSPSIQQFVKTYADSIGCNEKCILFPLLTCCAACMGPTAYLELTANWHEPAIIWTLIVTPMTLHRIDVAEHIKQQLLTVQNELSAVKTENNSTVYNKFVVDVISLDSFQEVLRSNDGQALGLYNTTRALHNTVSTPQDVEIMHRLHTGSSWFSNSKMTKKLLSKTHVNFSLLSCPTAVHNSLVTAPNFQELYHDCFLTICAEENHVKFSQLSTASQCESLQRIFRDIITLHSSANIVYKLSEEANTKFSTIHDEITDKAKQLARKNSAKVFYPALSYLARLSCVLHVLDNVLEAINFTVPVDPLTWNSEISADTVWRARQVLGYVIEQKFVLSQPTMVETNPSATKAVESVTVIDNPTSRLSNIRSNVISTPQRSYISPHRITPVNSPRGTYTSPQRQYVFGGNSPRGRAVINSARNLQQPSSDAAFDLLLASSNTNANNNTAQMNPVTQEEARTEPMISEVRSAGVPVPVDSAIIESINTLNSGNGRQSSVSLSVVGDSNVAPNSNRNASSFTPQSVALMSEDEFCSSFKVQIRRFLMHGIKEMSLKHCMEFDFAPKPRGGYQSTEQKAAMSRIFLKRLETLGFGTFDGSNGTNSRNCTFKKRRYTALTDKQHKLLTDIRISELEYEKCFRTNDVVNNQNGSSIVCLE